MKWFYLPAALLLANMAPALAAPMAPQPCEVSRVDDSSGEFVRLTDGIIYETYPGRSRVAASLWLPQDSIQVCPIGGSADMLRNLSRPHSIVVEALNLME